MIISQEQRAANIIAKATSFGFDANDGDVYDATAYLIDNTPVNEEEEIEIKYGRDQYYNYNDGMGFEKSTQGDIVDWDEYHAAEVGDKIYVGKEVDSLGAVVALYIIKK